MTLAGDWERAKAKLPEESRNAFHVEVARNAFYLGAACFFGAMKSSFFGAMKSSHEPLATFLALRTEIEEYAAGIPQKEKGGAVNAARKSDESPNQKE